MANSSMLNEDILWTIFTLIAKDNEKNMFNKLQCVLNGTLVCRQCRQCLLSATNVWGRLIFVDSNRLHEKKPTVELLELITNRSGGTSPLFIEATAAYQKPDTGLRLFLCQFMEEAWERIQEIHFEMIDKTIDQQIRKRTRAVIARPAPNLRVFYVHGSDFDITHDSDFDLKLFYRKLFREKRYPTDHLLPAFANFAPRLEVFLVSDVYFPLQAAWLSGLRSLVVAYRCTKKWFTDLSLSQLLEVLECMPRLESLKLCHLQSFNPINIPQEGKHVDLPNLKYMMLSGHPDICVFIRDHVLGAQTGCLLDLELVVEEAQRDDDSHFTSLGDLFSTTLQRNMTLASPPHQRIESGTTPRIQLRYSCGPSGKENSRLLEALLAVFTQFSDATTLELIIMEMANYYVECLLVAMTAVTTLEVAFSETLYWLTFIRWNGTDHLVFPKLQTLRVHIDGP
ncbi:hypothetical protein CPC08DRAFT_755481, partial [Agrocybe pediades]